MVDRVSREQLPTVITATGIFLVGLMIVETTVLLASYGHVPTSIAAGLATSVPFAVLLVAGGFWLRRSGLQPARYKRLAAWVLVGVAFLGGFTAFIAMVATDVPLGRVAIARWGVCVGAGVGFGVGVFEARAIDETVTAELESARATELDRRRELLAYLNSLLRHEVLNSANVIEGYADLLADSDVDPETRVEYARLVQSEAQDVASITKDVRVLLQATDGRDTMRPMNLESVVRTELVAVDERNDAVETSLSGAAGDTMVAADDLLPRIYSNLFENAVKHDDDERTRIDVDVARDDDVVTVRVADDGPGVPVDKREGLFEYSSEEASDHGLGLSIVATLADRYGGRVDLTETGPDGSTFTVTHPVADGAGASESSTSASARMTTPGAKSG